MQFGLADILLMLGGLGLFLYGMRLMGDGLELAAGSKLKKLLSALTTNRLMGVLVGFLVTAVIQSSSATTVMVIGFVNAGLMTLSQAAGVIMGANIGTTVTSQIIAFRIGGFAFTDFAPLFIFVGVIFIMFSKKSTLSHIGQVVGGLGILFLGLTTMSTAMEPLQQVPEFVNLLTSFKNPLIGILVGALFTAIIQSSSASVGILQALAMQGLIGLDGAIFVLCGQNIGTCVTALISSIGANKTARRAAILHLLFNVIGTLLFIPIVLIPGIGFVNMVESLSPGNAAQQIANAHIIFNIVTTLVLLPASPLLVRMATALVPGKDKKEIEPMQVQYLDHRILKTPPIAVGQVIKETERMAVLSRQNFHDSLEYFNQPSPELKERIMANEQVLDYLNKEITAYLIQISALELTASDSATVGALFHTVNDFERIGDHAENIVDAADEMYSRKVKFSDTAAKEIKELTLRVEVLLDEALHMFRSRVYDESLAQTITRSEEDIDRCNEAFRNNHIKRLTKRKCTPEQGAVFLDLLTNLERVADHATNIAFSIHNGAKIHQ
ncbi:Na/Pi cotransporter family protein [Solibaculum mannosilyticum]|uniref:Na/Pi cotransporter family protein n=1 Tax=Solibaculum mannosilyticum TaxID=2780922 RepID=UPI0007A81A68|nr:transcriptional regulator PhoU [Eubacteriaceae bacterium CHKCI005]